MLWFTFARRYMFSPKSHSVINIIAMVSVIAVAVPTAATIILLAMFSGLDKAVREIYSTADADIEIVSTRGQIFSEESIDRNAIADIDGVVNHTAYIEQSVMIASAGNKMAVTLRGIDDGYDEVFDIEGHVVNGSPESIAHGGIIAGTTIVSTIGVPAIGAEVELYALNRKQLSTLLPSRGISRVTSHLGGVSMVNAELDAKYVLMDIAEAQQLLNHRGKITTIALDIEDGADIESIRNEVQSIVGEEFKVLTSQEKNASMNEIMKLEKFAIMLIGCFIAMIATFSIVGSVVMLITEKRRDIGTLRAMGADKRLIRRIFVGEGILLTLCGTLIGTVLGIGFALIQMHYGIIPLEGNMVLDSYPVAIEPLDIVIVDMIMVGLGWLISYISVRATLQKYSNE